MADNMNIGAMGQTSAPPMQRMRPGGFWRRFAAYFIDSLIVGIAFVPLGILLVPFANSNSASGMSVYWGGQLILKGLQLAVTFCYFGYFLSKKGASPGKMVLGLKVVDNDNGTNLSFMMAGLRCTVGYMISAITLLIGFIMAGVRQDKKALHDLIFNSHVWYKES